MVRSNLESFSSPLGEPAIKFGGFVELDSSEAKAFFRIQNRFGKEKTNNETLQMIILKGLIELELLAIYDESQEKWEEKE